MCEHTVKRLPYIIRYDTDNWKTQQTSDGGTLNSVHDCYKNQEICTVVKQLIITLIY